MTTSVAPMLRYVEGRRSSGNYGRKKKEPLLPAENADWTQAPLEQVPFKALVAEILSRHSQLLQENISLTEAFDGKHPSGEKRRTSQNWTSQGTLTSRDSGNSKFAPKHTLDSSNSTHSNAHLTHKVFNGELMLDDIALEAQAYSSEPGSPRSPLVKKKVFEDDMAEEVDLAFVPDEAYTQNGSGYGEMNGEMHSDWSADLAITPNASILEEIHPLQESRESTRNSGDSEIKIDDYPQLDYESQRFSFSAIQSCDVGDFAQESPERFEAGSLEASTTAHDIFPSWFVTRQQRSSVSDMMEQLYMDEEEGPSYCAMSCTGRARMIWDLLWSCILLYEMWATPFTLVFMDQTEDQNVPQWFKTSEILIIVVFSIDIVLNFFTGYIYKDKEVLNLPEIATNYITGWFWLDLFSTIPWDDIVISTTDALSTTRSMKSLRAFKILKLFKLMRVVKAIQLFQHMKRKQAKGVKRSISLEKNSAAVKNRSLRGSAARKQSSSEHGYGLMSKRTSQTYEKTWFRRRILKPAKRLWQRLGLDIATEQLKKLRLESLELGVPIFKGMLRILMLLFGLVLVAHVNALLWALVRDDWSPTSDVEVGVDRYWECFWRVFAMILGGISAGGESSLGLQFLELLILVERLFLVWHALAAVLYQAFMMQEMSAHDSLRNNNALKYLKRHGASPSTQLQFLFNAQETGALRTSQRHFHELMNTVMPSELRRAILEELWCERLLSLGLILKVAQWRSDFVNELAQVVREETYASRVIITKEGDLAIAAYHILSGEVNVITASQSQKIPPFTTGMWIGEKSLVNPMLRRSGTVVTTILSIVMTVPAQIFRTLLKDLGLKGSFENFCSTELWKGLCGRCGSIGEHFGHECPHMVTTRPSYKANLPTKTESDADANQSILAKDLRVFLERSRLERLTPAFAALRICSLDEMLSAEDLVAQLSAYVDITQAEIEVLSEENILNFRQTIKRSTIHMMETSGKYRHLLFLSHYKMEAGTEAALMRSDIELALGNEDEQDDNPYDTPVFLDSEDLTDLQEIMREVKTSEYLVLMLTKSVLTRPWCLLEIVTALKTGIPVLAVNIIKAGCEFTYPDESFYQQMMEGKILGESGVKLLQDFGVQVGDVCHALRKVLQRIAVPYSPHRPLQIRQAELEVLLRQTRGAQAAPG